MEKGIPTKTKTTLSNVALYTKLLAEQELTDEQAKFAEQISVSADKLTFISLIISPARIFL
jgi:hypothetical protein